MNTNNYAEFLQIMGYRVLETKSTFWYEVNPFSYISFPFDRLINLDEEEVSNIWHRSNAMVIRYPTFESSKGYKSYRLICDNKNYNLYSLSKKARNQTRRGLESCLVREIDFSYLVKHGEGLYISTLLRQGRNVPAGLSNYWKKYCETASKIVGFQAWGAFVEGQLAAFLIGFLMDNCFNVFIQRSAQRMLRHYPNNALVYTVTKDVLSREEINEISFGLEPLQLELEGLDHFKVSMGFKKCEIKQRVLFRPPLHGIVVRTGSIILRLAEKNSEKEFWRKLGGAVTFALQS